MNQNYRANETKTTNIACRLRELLTDVVNSAGRDFEGVGIVIASEQSVLPLFPMRSTLPSRQPSSVARCLATISSSESEYHDGFHILNSKFDLVAVSQYFSPPIVPEVKVDYKRPFGGRFLAALFGSALPGVLATGVISRSYGIVVFVDGQEVV